MPRVITYEQRKRDQAIADLALDISSTRWAGELSAATYLRRIVRAGGRTKTASSARWWWWRLVFEQLGAVNRVAAATGFSNASVSAAIDGFAEKFSDDKLAEQLADDLAQLETRAEGIR